MYHYIELTKQATKVQTDVVQTQGPPYLTLDVIASLSGHQYSNKSNLILN